MFKALSGIILIGIIIGMFYLLAKQMDVFGQDNSDDDFSCH